MTFTPPPKNKVELKQSIQFWNHQFIRSCCFQDAFGNKSWVNFFLSAGSTTLPCLSYVPTCPMYLTLIVFKKCRGSKDYGCRTQTIKNRFFFTCRMWPLNEACHWCAVFCERKVQIADGHCEFVYPIFCKQSTAHSISTFLLFLTLRVHSNVRKEYFNWHLVPKLIVMSLPRDQKRLSLIGVINYVGYTTVQFNRILTYFKNVQMLSLIDSFSSAYCSIVRSNHSSIFSFM